MTLPRQERLREQETARQNEVSTQRAKEQDPLYKKRQELEAKKESLEASYNKTISQSQGKTREQFIEKKADRMRKLQEEFKSLEKAERKNISFSQASREDEKAKFRKESSELKGKEKERFETQRTEVRAATTLGKARAGANISKERVEAAKTIINAREARLNKVNEPTPLKTVSRLTPQTKVNDEFSTAVNERTGKTVLIQQGGAGRNKELLEAARKGELYKITSSPITADSPTMQNANINTRPKSVVMEDMNPPKRNFFTGIKKGFFNEYDYSYSEETSKQTSQAERRGAEFGNILTIPAFSKAPKVIVGAKTALTSTRPIQFIASKTPAFLRSGVDLFATPIAAGVGVAEVGKAKEDVFTQQLFRTTEERKEFAGLVLEAQQQSKKKGTLNSVGFELSGGLLGSNKDVYKSYLRGQLIEKGYSTKRVNDLVQAGVKVRGTRGRTEIYAILASGGATEVKATQSIAAGFLRNAKFVKSASKGKALGVQSTIVSSNLAIAGASEGIAQELSSSRVREQPITFSNIGRAAYGGSGSAVLVGLPVGAAAGIGAKGFSKGSNTFANIIDVSEAPSDFAGKTFFSLSGRKLDEPTVFIGGKGSNPVFSFSSDTKSVRSSVPVVGSSVPLGTTFPVSPPVGPPISPPVSPPVSPPISPPVSPPVSPPISPPVSPPISPPVSPPISPPVNVPVSIGVPTIIPVITPQFRGGLPLALPKGLGSSFKGFARNKKSSLGYNPSAFSLFTGLTGKSTKGGVKTGFSIRPITPPKKSSKKKNDDLLTGLIYGRTRKYTGL